MKLNEDISKDVRVIYGYLMFLTAFIFFVIMGFLIWADYRLDKLEEPEKVIYVPK